MSKYTVVMTSTEFGREEFPRDTVKEVRETIRNLKKAAKKLNDGIERQFTIEDNRVDKYEGQAGELVSLPAADCAGY
jgi:uncharacterized protein Yka (UPF0111/DUF47 family)